MLSYFEKNIIFINQNYERFQIPKEYSFLKKYFNTKPQRDFLKYYFVMKDERHFSTHTGHAAHFSFVSKMKSKFNYFMEMYEKAKKDMDFETLTKLNSREVILIKRLR
jgi:hypothetical protein